MPLDLGYTFATGLGAAVALSAGIFAHRYEHLLERRSAHVESLADVVLRPWKAEVASRLSNLSGDSPYVGLDFITNEYTFQPGAVVYSRGSGPLDEQNLLVDASKRHWPTLWATWRSLNSEFEELAKSVILTLRGLESRFPPLPAGKEWAHYPDAPATAIRMAVVNAWAENGKLWQRATYPNYVRGRFANLGLWRGDGDASEKQAYADAILAVFRQAKPAIDKTEAVAASLAEKLKGLLRALEDAELRGTIRHRCKYCPRLTTPV